MTGHQAAAFPQSDHQCLNATELNPSMSFNMAQELRIPRPYLVHMIARYADVIRLRSCAPHSALISNASGTLKAYTMVALFGIVISKRTLVAYSDNSIFPTSQVR